MRMTHSNLKKYLHVLPTICLGVILKGETAHFEYISSATINGLMNVQLEMKTPIINGILNCYNLEQVKERLDNVKSNHFSSELSRALISVLEIL